MWSYQNIKHLVLTVMGSAFMFGMQLMLLFSENKADFTKLLCHPGALLPDLG
jgi:hypothetical protein